MRCKQFLQKTENWKQIILDNILLTFVFVGFISSLSFASPNRINFQAKIKKPDGSNLEAPDVSFRFKYINSAGNCTLYMEDFNNISMFSSAGNVSFSLGSGAKVFPPTATDLAETFSNTPTNSMSCLEGGNYAPISTTEHRKLRVEFIYNGSGGLQALNGIEINSTPYAMYASDADKLAGFAASLYAKFSDFTTCTGGQFLTYNGTAFSCLTPGASSSFTGNLVGDVTGTQSATVVDAVGGKTSAQVSTSVDDTTNATNAATASRIVKRDGSGNAAFNTAQANNFSGRNILLFEPTDTNKVTIKAPTTFAAGDYTITLPDSKGSAGYVLSTDGNGVTSWIPAASGSVTTVTATPPLLSSGGATPDISMPAATAAVDGYLSAANFTTFNNKVSSQWTNNLTDIFFNTGNVGIGTNTPTNKIHVVETSYNQFRLQNGAQSLWMRQGYKSDGTATPIADANNVMFQSSGASTGTFSFTVGNSEALRIDISGNVGIGTTTPVYKLDVAGDVNITGNYKVNGVNIGSGTLGGTGTANKVSKFSAANTLTDSVITDDGTHVGIGTATPTNPLTVQGTGGMGGGGPAPLAVISTDDAPYTWSTIGMAPNLTAGNSILNLLGKSANTNDSGYMAFNYVAPGSASNFMSFGLHSSNNLLNITGGGRVGIGTTAPEAPLDVRSGIKAANNVLSIFKTTDAQPQQFFIENRTNTGITLQAAEQFVGNNNLFLNPYGGNVGVGTFTPTNRLSISADANTSSAPENSQILIQGATNPTKHLNIAFNTSSNYGELSAETSAGVYAPINLNPNGGNIGIGLTVPAYKLDVAGDINVTGNFKVNGVNVPLIASQWTTTGADIYNSNAGNVGVGTAGAPTSKLHVAGDMGTNAALATMTNPMFSLQNTSATDGSMNAMLFHNRAGFATAGIFNLQNGINGGTQMGLVTKTAGSGLWNTDQLILDPSGNVGIGTAAPGAKLQVGTTGTDEVRLGKISFNTNVYNYIDESFGVRAKLADAVGAHRFIVENSTGTAVLSAKSDGNVGIGTNSPTAKLTIQGTSAAGPSTNSDNITNYNGSGLRLEGGIANTSREAITYSSGAGGGAAMVFERDSGYGTGISLFTNPNGNAVAGDMTKRFTILSNGNVGIGTGTPAHKLDVAGDINVTGNFKVNGVNIPLVATQWTTNGTHIYNNNAGNVGIGTSTPLEKFQVFDGNVSMKTSSTTTPVLKWQASDNSERFAISGATETLGGSIDEWKFANLFGFTSFYNSGVQTMHLTSDNKVGIGTSTPGAKLDVQGSILIPHDQALRSGSSNWIIGQQSSPLNEISIGSTVVANDIRFDSSTGALMTIKNTGNVGIGTAATNPAAKLEVAGDVNIGIDDPNIATVTATYGNLINFLGANNNSDPFWMARYNVASDNSELRMNIGDNPTGPADKFVVGLNSAGWIPRFTVQSDGKVGINNNAPAYALDVNGDVNITGNFKVGGTNMTSSQWTTSAPNIYYNTGNVGIGTNTPNGPLHIKTASDIYAAGSLLLENSTHNTAYAMINSNNKLRFGYSTDQAGNYPQASYGDAFTLDGSTGNVGIGTASPTGLLHIKSISSAVNGLMTLENDSGATTNLYTARSVLTHANTGVLENASGILINPSGGNVGIGVITPTAKLHISGGQIRSEASAIDTDITRLPADSEIVLETAGNGSTSAWLWREKWAAGNYGVFHDNTGDSLLTVGNGNPVMSVGLSSLNVGVGIRVPTEKFEVAGAAKAGNFYVNKSSYVHAQNAGDEWLRIASGFNNSSAEFKVTSYASSQHGFARFNVDCNYPNGAEADQCVISLLSRSEHSAFISVKAIRVLRQTTYDPYYVEILVGNNASASTNVIIETKDNFNFTVPATPSAGSIPAGYTAILVNTEHTMASFGNGNLNVKTGSVDIGSDTASMTGYGIPLTFLGQSNNSDPMWIARYNNGGNVSEMRVNLGDDPGAGPAADRFVIGTTTVGWNPSMTVMSTGKVAIGASHPDPISPLHVVSGEMMNGNYRRVMTLEDEHPVIQFKGHSNTNHSGFVGYDSEATTEALNFWVGGTTDDMGAATYAMRLRANGNVGIGTLLPTHKLDVDGDVNIAAANSLLFGGTPICTVGGCVSPSDLRLKENVKPLDNSLSKILRLQGVEYDYKDKAKFGDKHQVGVIAQDVEKVFPEVVVTNDKTGLKAVAYDHLIAPVIEAIKSLYARILDHDREIASVKAENIQLKQENSEIKAYLCSKDPSAPICK